MKNRIDEDLHKIFTMLVDMENRNKNPQYRELIRKLKKQYNKDPKCPSCGNPTHEKDFHRHWCAGEWK